MYIVGHKDSILWFITNFQFSLFSVSQDQNLSIDFFYRKDGINYLLMFYQAILHHIRSVDAVNTLKALQWRRVSRRKLPDMFIAFHYFVKRFEKKYELYYLCPF